MSLPTLTERIRTIVGPESDLKAVVKFATDEGVVWIDTKQSPPVISNEDQEAECVLELSATNALQLLDGDLNPMMAYMMGKLKIKGDMGIAMKIAEMFK